jgi:hypothetical protein
MANAPGTISPAEGLDFKPAADTVSIPSPGPGDGINYREATGGGEKTWGVGFGFNFLNSGPNPFANCEAGACMGTPPANDAGVGFADKYDATMHKGFAFWARNVGDAATIKVNVQVADKHTHPNGGTCNPCLNGGAMACADDYIESKAITNTWSQISIQWTDTSLKQVGWSNLKGTFDPSTLYYIHLQVIGSATAPSPNFDIQVAYFTWLD